MRDTEGKIIPENGTPEIRSLNYNRKRGYSEHRASDPNWQENENGTKTILI